MVQGRQRKTTRKSNADGCGTKVSVVIPAYNAEKTIAGAIQSVRIQTVEPHEIIVVDDGSTDDTLRIATQFPDVLVASIEHSGPAVARNDGVKMATGEWILLQDADDYSLPDRIERLIPEMREADVLIHGMYTNAWNAQFGCMERHYVPPRMPSDELLQYQTVSGVLCVRKERWEQRPLRSRYLVDWLMHLEWYFSGFRYKTIDRGLYEYVRYQGSTSDRFEKEGKRAKEYERIKEIIRNEYGKQLA